MVSTPTYTLKRLLALSGALLVTALLPLSAQAFSVTGKSWPSGTVTFQLSLGNAPATLADGNTSWNAAAAPALTQWSQRIERVQLVGVMDSSAPVSSGDRVNSITFSNNIFGQNFGNGTLAVTYFITQGANLLEADVLFNRSQSFDSYRGPLRFLPTGYALGDIRRVLLHELGHGIGVSHSEGDNVMSSLTSDREILSEDDTAAGQTIYGARAPVVASPTARLANISTRMKVGLLDDALIGGFIVSGAEAKRVILRATGPSLASSIPGAMADPKLELFNSAGQMVASNDNWQTGGQVAEVVATGVAPANPAEPALIASLAPGSYTAVVRGVNNGQGVALVEGYELDQTASRFVNLSTRGRVGVSQEVMIGGLIVQGTAGKKVLVRAIGPSLAKSVNGALPNPHLEMFDASGNLVAQNDDWQSSAQRSEIIASTVAPTSNLESAIVTTLPPGGYTAVVRGANNEMGIALIEIYDLEP